MSQDQQISIADAITRSEGRFKELAPAYMQYEAEKGFATQLLKNNAYLSGIARSAPESLQYAIINVAAIGLSLNPAEKLAYLIPRNLKVKDARGKDTWVNRIFLEPSYIGLCKLATDSGSIKWVQANCVYAADTFEDNGPGEKPTHKYAAMAKSADRGEFVGVYCVAKTADGDYLTTIMPSEDVMSIRSRSESWKQSQKGPWADDFSEQAKKSVVRRASKMWPKTNLHRLAQAVELSNQNEGFEPLISAPPLGQPSAYQKNYFDSLISASDGLGMYVFQQTLQDESMFVSLYHSFEKGSKGRYQAIVDDLLRKGQAAIVDYRDELTNAAREGDDLRAGELVVELTNDQLTLVMARVDTATAAFVEGLKNG